MRDLRHVLQSHGEEGERCRAEDGEDGVRGSDAAGRRRPDESQVHEGNQGNLDFDSEEEFLGAVEDRGGDGGGDEADDDEYCAGDAGFFFGEAVGGKHLVEEGGDGVEEADVDGVGDEHHDELAGFEESLYGRDDVQLMLRR